MKRFSIMLSVFLAVLTAGAQMDTNALAAPAVTNAASTMMNTNASARAMSLQDCIQEALQHNFDVQIQRYNPQVARYNLSAAYGGYDPTFNASGQHIYNDSGATFQNGQRVAPSETDENAFSSSVSGWTPWGLNYNLFGNVSDTYGQNFFAATNLLLPIENSSGQIGIALTQPLLKNFWIDNTRLNIRVAKNRLKYSEQGLRQQLINSVTAVELAYYELIFAQGNVKVRQEALRLAQTQLDQDNQRVQIGTIAERAGTIEQDEAQVAQSQADLISALSTLGTDQRALKYLLTDEYSKWFASDIRPTATLTAPPRSFDLQESWRQGLTERPDVLQARLNVEQQGIFLKYYRNQLFPELDLIGSYGFNGAGKEYSDVFAQYHEGNRPFYSYGGQLSVPLSSVGPRNQYKSTKATLQQVILSMKQIEQNVMVLIDNAVGVAESDYQSVQASRQARIFAEAALDAEQKKYAVGKSTTFDVLQLQNKLTAARSQEIRDLANYNQALTILAQQEGSTLERNRVDLQAK